MAKTLAKVAVIAGAVALIATGVGAIGGAAFAASALGGTIATVATYASLAAGLAGIGASLLAKPPPARGNVTQVLIGPDVPQPYMMGEGYFAGVQRHDTAYGATLKKVPNPFRWMVNVYSGGGPVESISPRVDKAAVSSWYSGFLATDTQLGACPESTALVPPYGTAPGWDSTSKLSGQAAIGWNLKFDKDGKRFASGIPQLGAEGQWVKCYDPRLDSTRAGGSGSCRVDDESTWPWTESPALHAGTYAYGRHQNGKRVFGCGLPDGAIDWAGIAAWAEVCDANDWTIFGVIYEPGNRWTNLKEIAAAGGAVPVIAGGRLSFKVSAPHVSLDTIGPEDLADDPLKVTAQASFGERLNTIIPRYTSAAHEWQQIAGEAVSVSTYVTEDGEEKATEWPFNLVRDANQAAQLAAYKLVDGREFTPIIVPCGPRMRHYRPGECLTLALPDYELEFDAVILQRTFDVATMTVTFVMIGETPAKHDYALGLTATPPATPALGQTAEERDEIAAVAVGLSGSARFWKSKSINPFSSTDTTITVAAFDGVLDDGRQLNLAGDTITGLTDDTVYYAFYRLIEEDYVAVAFPADAEMANSSYAYIGAQRTEISGGGYTPPSPPPPGYGGGGWDNPIP